MKREGLVERVTARRTARGAPVRPMLQPQGAAPEVRTPPTNVTPETALAMTLPFALDLVDMAAVVAADQTLYYTYTPGPGETIMGFSALSSPFVGGVYAPFSQVLVGGVPYLALEGLWAAFQVPVVPGTMVTFAVSNGGTPTPPSVLQIRAEAGPRLASPIGALAIPDDTTGFPATILSSATGGVLQTQPLPAGESAAMLPSGISLWEDYVAHVLQLWDVGFVTPLEVTWDYPTRVLVASNRQDRFYLGDPGGTGGPVRVTSVNTAGVFGPTIWTLGTGGLSAIAVSRDDTILYFVGLVPRLGAPIRRWDLVANSALTNLAAGVTNYLPGDDLLVLDDGSILAGYLGDTDPLGSFVRRYAPDGTILQLYDLGAVDLNHLTYAMDDTAFWVWSYPHALDNYSRFTQLQVADGAVLETFDAKYYNGGIDQGPAPVPGTFAHAFSCPFITVPFPLPGTPPDQQQPGVSYHIDARYIRRLRRAPHVANENTRMVYRTFELDLERGVGLATGQGEEPLVMLRLSRDGGHTWGEPQLMSAGRLGAYSQRVIARRLGQARDTVFEVTVSDPVAWSLVQAWLDLEPGTS